MRIIIRWSIILTTILLTSHLSLSYFAPQMPPPHIDMFYCDRMEPVTHKHPNPYVRSNATFFLRDTKILKTLSYDSSELVRGQVAGNLYTDGSTLRRLKNDLSPHVQVLHPSTKEEKLLKFAQERNLSLLMSLVVNKRLSTTVVNVLANSKSNKTKKFAKSLLSQNYYLFQDEHKKTLLQTPVELKTKMDLVNNKFISDYIVTLLLKDEDIKIRQLLKKNLSNYYYLYQKKE